MSAICGIVRFDGAPVEADVLERVLATMRHRTPDGQRIARDGVIGLGHGLLQVTEEDRF